MRIQDPYVSAYSDDETELLFPNSFGAEQGFNLAEMNLVIAKHEAAQARELLSLVSASILGYGPSTSIGANPSPLVFSPSILPSLAPGHAGLSSEKV